MCHTLSLYLYQGRSLSATSLESFRVNLVKAKKFWTFKILHIFYPISTTEIFLTYFINYFSFLLFLPLVLGFSLFKIVAVITAPLAVLKALISCMHAYVASVDLANVDKRERLEKRAKEASKRSE